MKRMNHMLVLFLTLTLVSQSLLAEVRASLSRSAIQSGDTVTLNILATGDVDGANPDLDVLQQDFQVLGTGSSQQTSIINGRVSSSQQWSVQLLPKREGELQVPAITVGKERTAVLTLTVSAQPAATLAEAGEPLFIKTRLEPEGDAVYVQQQLRYTLQLYYRERLYDGSFDGPQVEHALVERLGDDTQFQTTVNGQQYVVIERRYAIFPERSGPLTIAPVTFSGRLAAPSRQRAPGMPSMQMNDMMERFFGNLSMSSPGQRVRLRGESYTLDVKPRADAFTGQHWLPAADLQLTDSWAAGPPEFRNGEPVTRTITLEAKGLESTHLPELNVPDTPGMRIYPEAAVHNNRTDGEWVFGRLERTFAYVPSTAGQHTLPAVRVDWWDTGNNRQQTATLPSWSINVEPGEGVLNAQQPAAPDKPSATADGEMVRDVSHAREPGAQNAGAAGPLIPAWGWAAAGLLFLLIPALVVYRARGTAAPVKTDIPAVSARSLRTELERACAASDAHAAARALLALAAQQWPDDPPRNLGAVRQRLTTGADAVAGLEAALYGTGQAAWEGSALWRAVGDGLPARASQQAASASSELSPLYPDWKH